MDTYILNQLYSGYMAMFLGNFGKGKSLSATYLNTMHALFNKRKVILSNTPYFHMSSYGIEFIPLISTSQLSEGLRDVQISLDEVQKIANSRDSLSARNSFVTEFSTDVRKFNQGIVGTAQFERTYDIRISDNTNIYILPEWAVKQGKDRDDFRSIWNVLIFDEQIHEQIELNLESFIWSYDTNYKPDKIVVNHPEYLEHIEESKSQKYYENYMIRCDKSIAIQEKRFKNIMKKKE